MPKKDPYPHIDELPEHLFGNQRFRRQSFREYMLEKHPVFRARLLEAFEAEDLVAGLPPVTETVQ